MVNVDTQLPPWLNDPARRRKADSKVVTCACDSLESDVIKELKRLCGVTTDANLLRTALWSLADEWMLNLPDGVFDMRPHMPPRALKATKAPMKASAMKETGRKQARFHPWVRSERSRWSLLEGKTPEQIQEVQK